MGWTEKDLTARLKNDPGKMAIAERLRKETTLSAKRIAALVHLGSPKSARATLHRRKQNHERPIDPILCPQLEFQPIV